MPLGEEAPWFLFALVSTLSAALHYPERRRVERHGGVDNSGAVVDDARAVATPYAYELRQGDEILATGRLTADEELGPGDELTVAGIAARIDELSWADGERRLLLEASHRMSVR